MQPNEPEMNDELLTSNLVDLSKLDSTSIAGVTFRYPKAIFQIYNRERVLPSLSKSNLGKGAKGNQPPHVSEKPRLILNPGILLESIDNIWCVPQAHKELIVANDQKVNIRAGTTDYGRLPTIIAEGEGMYTWGMGPCRGLVMHTPYAEIPKAAGFHLDWPKNAIEVARFKDHYLQQIDYAIMQITGGRRELISSYWIKGLQEDDDTLMLRNFIQELLQHQLLELDVLIPPPYEQGSTQTLQVERFGDGFFTFLYGHHIFIYGTVMDHPPLLSKAEQGTLKKPHFRLCTARHTTEQDPLADMYIPTK